MKTISTIPNRLRTSLLEMPDRLRVDCIALSTHLKKQLPYEMAHVIANSECVVDLEDEGKIKFIDITVRDKLFGVTQELLLRLFEDSTLVEDKNPYKTIIRIPYDKYEDVMGRIYNPPSRRNNNVMFSEAVFYADNPKYREEIKVSSSEYHNEAQLLHDWSLSFKDVFTLRSPPEIQKNESGELEITFENFNKSNLSTLDNVICKKSNLYYVFRLNDEGAVFTLSIDNFELLIDQAESELKSDVGGVSEERLTPPSGNSIRIFYNSSSSAPPSNASEEYHNEAQLLHKWTLRFTDVFPLSLPPKIQKNESGELEITFEKYNKNHLLTLYHLIFEKSNLGNVCRLNDEGAVFTLSIDNFELLIDQAKSELGSDVGEVSEEPLTPSSEPFGRYLN